MWLSFASVACFGFIVNVGLSSSSSSSCVYATSFSGKASSLPNRNKIPIASSLMLPVFPSSNRIPTQMLHRHGKPTQLRYHPPRSKVKTFAMASSNFTSTEQSSNANPKEMLKKLFSQIHDQANVFHEAYTKMNATLNHYNAFYEQDMQFWSQDAIDTLRGRVLEEYKAWRTSYRRLQSCCVQTQQILSPYNIRLEDWLPKLCFDLHSAYSPYQTVQSFVDRNVQKRAEAGRLISKYEAFVHNFVNIPFSDYSNSNPGKNANSYAHFQRLGQSLAELEAYILHVYLPILNDTDAEDSMLLQSSFYMAQGKFHAHLNKRWTDCLSQQLRIIEVAVSTLRNSRRECEEWLSLQGFVPSENVKAVTSTLSEYHSAVKSMEKLCTQRYHYETGVESGPRHAIALRERLHDFDGICALLTQPEYVIHRNKLMEVSFIQTTQERVQVYELANAAYLSALLEKKGTTFNGRRAIITKDIAGSFDTDLDAR